jgi:hypothetical protein
MQAWALDRVAGVVEQLVSELVTNCVEHAKTVSAMVLLVHTAGTLRIEVRDHDPVNLPVRRDTGPDDTSGRGLLIIEAWSDRWGVRVGDSGKSVWCELAAPRSAAEGKQALTDARQVAAQAACDGLGHDVRAAAVLDSPGRSHVERGPA